MPLSFSSPLYAQQLPPNNLASGSSTSDGSSQKSSSRLHALWLQFFSTPRYYDYEGGLNPFAPFCLGADMIRKPGFNKPIIYLSLVRTFTFQDSNIYFPTDPGFEFADKYGFLFRLKFSTKNDGFSGNDEQFISDQTKDGRPDPLGYAIVAVGRLATADLPTDKNPSNSELQKFFAELDVRYYDTNEYESFHQKNAGFFDIPNDPTMVVHYSNFARIPGKDLACIQ